MGFLAAMFSSFLTATIQMCISFVVLIWFTLSIIYAISEIINFLLGQPLIGWLLTGKISNVNDISFLFKHGMFNLTSPIMIFLYSAIVVSAFLFIFYFTWSLMPFNSSNIGELSSRVIGIGLIILATIWIPFLYSLLIIATSGLMVGLNSLINFNNSNNIMKTMNLPFLKSVLLKNLNQLKDLKMQMNFLYINTNSSEFKNYVEQSFNADTGAKVLMFAESWNQILSDSSLPLSQLNSWIDIVSKLDFDKIGKFNSAEIKTLELIGAMSQKLDQMKIYYNDIAKWISDPSDLKKFNDFFLSTKTENEFLGINLSDFSIREKILNINILSDRYNASNFSFVLVNSSNVFSNNFSQTIVNILYSIAIGEKDAVFVPGWSGSGTESSWKVISSIPIKMISLPLNITLFLFYNIKVLAVGGIINSFLLTGIIIFALILIRRFIFIAFWPLIILFKLAKSGLGDIYIVKESINQLFNKFISIIVFSLGWNLISLLTNSIFDAINNAEIFTENIWILDVLKLFLIIGIVWSSFLLIKEFLDSMEKNKTTVQSGASEAASAQSKLSRSKSAGVQHSSGMVRSVNKMLKSNSDNKNNNQNKSGNPFMMRVVNKMAGRFKK